MLIAAAFLWLQRIFTVGKRGSFLGQISCQGQGYDGFWRNVKAMTIREQTGGRCEKGR
jgi:hypothetical protein